MKTIILGVSSSVAAYKSVQLTSDLLKKGYDVEVIETRNALNFIAPLQFSSLTHHKTYTDTFEEVREYNIEHISLAKKASLFIIAPATANIIGKIANGICDDMLTTTFMACDCPKIIAPAMNTKMYENPIMQENLAKLKRLGIHIIEPAEGLLACKDSGKGKLAPIEELIDNIEKVLNKDLPLKGKKVLVSAGPTIEAIDPVRYITNHSSGKQGYAIAKAAAEMGAQTTLVSGPVNLPVPAGVRLIKIESAQEMYEAIVKEFDSADYVIKAAAVADYRPKVKVEQKIKKNDDQFTIELVKNPDILAYLGEHKTHQKICGFAMETENGLENAKAKFRRKNCDLLVYNDLFEEGAGFKGDTNVVTFITKDKVEKKVKMSKEDLAYEILETLMEVE